ncbi:MAG: hypothetical protein ACM3VU_00190 [Arthrospira platensis]
MTPLRDQAAADIAAKAVEQRLGESRAEAPAPREVSDGDGLHQEFARGSVYWSADTFAHSVAGTIRADWLIAGGALGDLGYPTSDERHLPDGLGRYQEFEHGTAYLRPATAPHAELLTWDFERASRLGWTGWDEPAFHSQPTFGPNVRAGRVVAAPPLGGDYWDVAYPLGNSGNYWIGTYENRPSPAIPWGRVHGDHLQGELRSLEFPVTAAWFSCLIAGGHDPKRLHVDLLIRITAENGSWITTGPAREEGRVRWDPTTGTYVYEDDMEIPGTPRDIIVIDEISYALLASFTGHDSEVFRLAAAYTSPYVGQIARIRIRAARTRGEWGHINVANFRMTETPPTHKVPVWGFADLHTHPFARLGFGGRMLFGDEDGPLEEALPPCAAVHDSVKHWAIDHQHGEGSPGFGAWPRFTTLIHQQMHVDWIRRAFHGGLRLMSALAVNSVAIAKSLPTDGQPVDDMSVARRQISAMRELVGRHSDWMEVAESPADARRIIAENKLAVVLGVELDTLFNVLTQAAIDGRQEGVDLVALADGPADILEEVGTFFSPLPDDGVAARAALRARIGELVETLHVRQLTPIHVADNAFGGAAIYNRFFNVANFFVTGRDYEVEDGSGRGIRYRLDVDGGVGFFATQTITEIFGDGFGAWSSTWSTVPGGHMNVRALTDHGVILLEELARAGLVIDIDHCSQKTADAALDLMEVLRYPVISSHSGFMELALGDPAPFTDQHAYDTVYGRCGLHDVPHESLKTPGQLDRLRRLHGMVAPILIQDRVRSWDDLKNPVANNCDGSSRTWAQKLLHAASQFDLRGVGLATDRGLLALPGPRFGPNAAFWWNHYRETTETRTGQVRAQTNGVRYDTPLTDSTEMHFSSMLDPMLPWDSAFGVDAGSLYTEFQLDVWHLLTVLNSTPIADPFDILYFPSLGSEDLYSFQTIDALNGVSIGLLSSTETAIDALIERAIRRLAPTDDAAGLSPPHRRWLGACAHGAYLVKTGGMPPAEEALIPWGDPVVTPTIAGAYEQVQPVYLAWQRMHSGTNPPISRSTAGDAVFDVNVDGVAHYGMLPDLLQDLKNIGMPGDVLGTLFRSAEDYIQVWERCESRAHELAAKGHLTSVDDAIGRTTDLSELRHWLEG